MKVECVQFWHTESRDASARETLPPHLRNELIEDAWGIQIDASKTQAIEEIEKFLQIGKTDTFVRYTRVEIDKQEIPNFSHFWIRPQYLGWKEKVFFETTPRVCNTCFLGVKISSPIQLSRNTLRGIGALEGFPMPHFKLLFLTAEVRELFESEGITGLEYGEFQDFDGGTSAGSLAHVTHCAHKIGTKIITKACTHRTIGGSLVFNEQVPADGLRNDFQMIDRVIVNGVEYAYDYPMLIVTQKALRLLLDHKVKRLDPMPCIVMKERFLPLIVS